MDIWRRHGQRLLAAVEVREWEREKQRLMSSTFRASRLPDKAGKNPFRGFLASRIEKLLFAESFLFNFKLREKVSH
jgi:hypothetical protein